MRVRITRKYNSTALKREVKVGEEFDVTEARGKALLKANVCEVIAEPTPTTEKVAVKKTTRKKEA